MNNSQITEDVMDFVKLSVAGTPPAASYFLGLPLQEWMFIASIVASVFFILDKLPHLITRTKELWNKFYAKRKKQGGSSGNSNSSCNSPQR